MSGPGWTARNFMAQNLLVYGTLGWNDFVGFEYERYTQPTGLILI
jgi:hypothetical protein